jgi:TonB family protein
MRAEILRAQRTTGHDAGALLRQVEQRGVNFRLSAADEQEFAAAGAPPALVAAVRGNNRTPVGREELEEMLRSNRRSTRRGGNAIVAELKKRGADFEVTPKDRIALRKAGASAAVLAALRANYRPTTRVEPKAPQPTSGVGSGSGMGAGSGSGVGPGRGQNTGGGDGTKGVGGGVSGGVGPGDAGPVDYTRAFRSNEVTARAIITSKPDPGYTEEARKNNVSGVVRLRVLLHASGLVTNIHVVKGLPDGLSERAIASARATAFRPAQKDGRTVSQWVLLEYNFNLY